MRPIGYANMAYRFVLPSNTKENKSPSANTDTKSPVYAALRSVCWPRHAVNEANLDSASDELVNCGVCFSETRA